LLIGGLAALASFLDLDEVINALTMARVSLHFIGQIIAPIWLRSRRPEVVRPFRMKVYPLPIVIAYWGWMLAFPTSAIRDVIFALLTVPTACVVFPVIAKWNRTRPFAIQA